MLRHYPVHFCHSSPRWNLYRAYLRHA